MKRFVLCVSLGLLAITAASLTLSSCSRSDAESSAQGKQVIILGIDGMDPGFLERHWDALPNLKRLRQDGDFRPLQTVFPPQSPVAWSTFITGADPGSTGIYDFIHRRPETLSLYSSMAQTTEGGHTLTLGPYRLPLSKGVVRNLRHGTPFWKILSERGVPVTILRMPTNFPPVDAGLATAGMGAPDLLGTFGTFTFFTDDPEQKSRQVSGGDIVRVHLDHRSAAKLWIPGPANSLRVDESPTGILMRAYVDSGAGAARFDLDGQQVILRPGEWSSWIHTHFQLIPVVSSVAGMFRIYVKQLYPRFEVYISPINIDPGDPALPITAPASYSRTLERAIGPFYTQGMAQDTSAWRQGVFDRADYLSQSREVSRQNLRMLRYGVDHFRDGLLFFHFFGVDQNSHMLWGKYDDDLLDTYRMVDETVGWVRRKLPKAILIIMSDHGFSTFTRAVNVNTWLEQAGFLALDESAASGGENFENIDWGRTRAYAAGLNAIYVNQEGRERDGIVSAGKQTDDLLAKIRERLLALRDPLNGNPVVHSVAIPAHDFHGPMLDSAPDLIVGYYPGYRGSWQTALGATPETLIDDNTDPWRGDHCIDPVFVPGVLLTNRKIRAQAPRLDDITVTALEEFGVDPPPEMVGHSVF
jgi:predicted AlkP superfamily phosphohydrolase/phosphomutase